ncbi:hotdog fold thioesterase [Solimonas sp. K1W22B-7]|uniref:hotdog fold thioesterase n=1 Tax=Solimonas sp. K1W22B-7 TaxID=2303331 RepID=UPI000E32E225|nr:hotdog fold thioesterase [Solimonas sp. K1W22B-7]AXQ28930.1 hotdog fold thioesterase [Solimonas sp. K1W22B-7]
MSELQNPTRQTLATTLDMDIVEMTKERVVARMPVAPKVHQPFGLLHGGASVALAETVASIGGWMNVDQSKEGVVGLEINANHLRGKRDGVVTAVATPIHVGRRTQVWEIRISDEDGKLVCLSRCTLAVVPAG